MEGCLSEVSALVHLLNSAEADGWSTVPEIGLELSKGIGTTIAEILESSAAEADASTHLAQLLELFDSLYGLYEYAVKASWPGCRYGKVKPLLTYMILLESQQFSNQLFFIKNGLGSHRF